MMQIISIIVVGFIVGLLARALKPGNDKLGLLMTTVLGIAGSAVANFAGSALGLYRPGEAAGWIASILGGILLLFLYGRVICEGAVFSPLSHAPSPSCPCPCTALP